MKNNDQILLEDIVKQEHDKNALDCSINEYFEIFVATQVLKDCELTYDDIDCGSVDGGGDGGIDGLYILVNGVIALEDFNPKHLKKDISIDVYIVQAKYTDGFKEDAINKLASSTRELFDLSYSLKKLRTVYKKQILSIVDNFRRIYKQTASRFPSLRFKYYYASCAGEVHPNVRRKIDAIRETLKKLFSNAEFDFKFLGAQELLTLARRKPVRTVDLSLAETPLSSSIPTGYVCLVKLKDYFSFISGDDGKLQRHLFDANVRDYQGSTQVNAEIEKSLSNRGLEDFWWLNNGVTIISSKAIGSGKVLQIQDPQIVNGLQTSQEIYNYFCENRDIEDQRNILVRVIETT